MGKRQPNKKYLLDKLKELAREGMDFPSHDSSAVTHVVPTKKIVKNTRILVNSCDDDELENWDITLYVNGSVLLCYYKKNSINSMINVAENGVSGIFAYRNIYEPMEVGINEINKINEIFKLAKEHGK